LSKHPPVHLHCLVLGGHIINNKKKKTKSLKIFARTLLLVLVPLILITLTHSREQQIARADDEEIVVTPPNKPHKPPKKFLGIWMTNGYGLQPNSDYYTIVDSPVTLRTDAGRSVWNVILGIFDGDHFRWSQSTDGQNWTEISKADGGYKKNFTVTPTEVGTVWYQLDTQYYNYATGWLGFKTHIYSNVAAVHTLPEAVEALELDVTADDDYLYNTSDKLSNTTYAHATPTPANATGEVTWAIDDTSLATIDENGMVTANSKSLSGTVTVTGTFTNKDGTSIDDDVEIRIGGGLDDQIVDSGEKATFTLLGNTGGSDDDDDDDDGTGTVTVDWYKYDPGASKGVKVSSGEDTFYTTPVTSMADDGSYFQAILTFSTGKVTKTITSNKAKLTVIPSSEPDIEITNKLINDTYQHQDNTDLHLIDSTGEDSITYHDTLTNKSEDGILKGGYYVIPMLNDTTVNSVKVAGEELTSDDYQIIPDPDTGSDNLVISVGDFDPDESKDVFVNTTAPDITAKKNFPFNSYVYGTNHDGEVYRNEGADEKIDYITNKILPKISDIDFGTVSAFSKGTLKYRPDELNSPNNMVNVDDERREKNSLKVFVTQNTAMTNDDGDILSASLRYYDSGNYSDILNNKTPIHQTDVGATLDSINWNKEDGLLLHINDNYLKGGRYTTTLNWSFEDSI